VSISNSTLRRPIHRCADQLSGHAPAPDSCTPRCRARRRRASSPAR
jgi:hypothetical protein